MKHLIISDQSGFTFLELVTIIVIVGILSYVAVANFTDSNIRLQYQTLAQKMATDVRYARELAFSEGEGTRVYIDQANNRYYLKWSDGSYIQNPVGGENFIIQLGTGDFSGVQISGTSFSGGRLDFDTSGAPLNSGAAFSGEITLVELNNAKRIVVVANTGLLKIEDI